MQPIRILINSLDKITQKTHFLFNLHDLKALLPQLSIPTFKTLLSRAVKEGYLERVCRGLYIYPKAIPHDGLLLFHIAARLRADEFNYISLETVLSDVGVISQVPQNWITIMTSGRRNQLSCGRYGMIEFIHTAKQPQDVMKELQYDEQCGLWRGSVALALEDMRKTHRNLDLIDWSVANEFIRPVGGSSIKK